MLSHGMASTENLPNSRAARIVWLYAATYLEKMVPCMSGSQRFSQLHCMFRGLQFADSRDLLRVRVDTVRAKLQIKESHLLLLDVPSVRVEE